MLTNPVIDTLLNRKSIRKYRPEQPSDEVVQTIARAGQQAPFAYQLCSLLLKRHAGRNPFHAPLLFTICVDAHRHALIMAQRGWSVAFCDLSLLIFGMQDAALVGENMVIAAESLGLGSCFLGGAPYTADQIATEYQLPPRVFPLVQRAKASVGSDSPTRPIPGPNTSQGRRANGTPVRRSSSTSSPSAGSTSRAAAREPKQVVIVPRGARSPAPRSPSVGQPPRGRPVQRPRAWHAASAAHRPAP